MSGVGIKRVLEWLISHNDDNAKTLKDCFLLWFLSADVGWDVFII